MNKKWIDRQSDGTSENEGLGFPWASCCTVSSFRLLEAIDKGFDLVTVYVLA